MKDLYKTVADHLAETVEELQEVTLFNNQLRKAGKTMISTPSVYLAFHDTRWKTMGKGVQRGKAILRVFLVYQTSANPRAGSPVQDRFLKFFDLLEKIHVALQGFGGENFSALDRTSTEADHDFTNFVVYSMDYQTQVVDDSAAPEVHEFAEPPKPIVLGHVDPPTVADARS